MCGTPGWSCHRLFLWTLVIRGNILMAIYPSRDPLMPDLPKEKRVNPHAGSKKLGSNARRLSCAHKGCRNYIMKDDLCKFHWHEALREGKVFLTSETFKPTDGIVWGATLSDATLPQQEEYQQ